jgi:hypothetical protein
MCLLGMMKNSQVNAAKTQFYMKGRVAAQFFTIMAVVAGSFLSTPKIKK